MPKQQSSRPIQVQFWRGPCAALAIIALTFLAPQFAAGGPIEPREGWEIIETEKAYAQLLEDLRAAIKAENMGLVTEAGPTEAARARGVEIPGNRVIGVFRNDFAVRILELSTAAMIEAPIRFYVTEAPNGTAWLSWRRPSFVFQPYGTDGGAELESAAKELDDIFSRIAARAVAN